jgi:hypothetical protein
MSCRQHPIPRIVDVNWVLDSWREKTVLSEERTYPSAGCLVANIRRISGVLIIGSCNNEINVNVLVVLPFFVTVQLNPR